MGTTLQSPSAWAEAEFREAQLHDVRRTRRLVRVASALAEHPSGLLPRVLNDWAGLKAAYRLFGEDDVSYERVIAPHWQHTRRACENPGDYLLVEDTTEVDFTSHYMTEDLGWTGDGGGRGMYLHTTLALRIERWTIEKNEPEVTALGLLGQKVWTRPQKTPDRLEKRRRRLTRSRESQRWAELFDRLGGPPPLARWTYVADRESDIYEVFERCVARRLDYIVRANQPRALSKEDGSVFDAVAQADALGSFEVFLRARPGQKARTAVVEVRERTVTLRGPWRPRRKTPDLSVRVVEAKEIDAPAGVVPIRWVLLTTWPTEDFVSCLRVVKAYAKRWLIEEYHKALKTGAGIEQSQLSSAAAIQALLGILAVVAVRLLNMKLLAASRPDEPIDPERVGPEVLKILEAKRGKPKQGWTHRTLLVRIAGLGGFLGRKSDGLPGWQTIWRGWDRLMMMVQGYDLAHNS
jgi:hypothetical protein